MNFDQVREQFLENVKNFEVLVKLDNGVHRHIEFRNKSGSSINYFGLVTWPGYLAYYGDMGEFVWWRTNDMFGFFRDPKMRINPTYWHEKLRAVDRSDGSKAFSIEKFRDVVMSYHNWFSDAEQWSFTEDDLNKIKTELESLVSEAEHYDNEFKAHELAHDWEWERSDGKVIRLEDFWEHDLKDYTLRYKWACYAVVWGINEYDKLKKEQDYEPV